MVTTYIGILLGFQLPKLDVFVGASCYQRFAVWSYVEGPYGTFMCLYGLSHRRCSDVENLQFAAFGADDDL